MSDLYRQGQPTRSHRKRVVAVGIVGLVIAGVAAWLVSPNGSASKTDHRMLRLAPDELSVPWRMVASQGTVIAVEVMAGGCVHFGRVFVDTSSPGELFVAAIDTDLGGPDVKCTSELRIVPFSTRIDSPVEGRRLIHAAVSSAWRGPKSWLGEAKDVPLGSPGPSSLAGCPPQLAWSSYEIPRCRQINESRAAGPLKSIDSQQVCFGFAGGPPPIDAAPESIRTCFRPSPRLAAESQRLLGTYVQASLDGGGRVEMIRPYKGILPI